MVWAVVPSAGLGFGFTSAVIGLPGARMGRPLSAAASPTGRGGSGGDGLESRSNLLVDCVSQGVSAGESLNLALSGFGPGPSFPDPGMRK
jgi:hypothetical protein